MEDLDNYILEVFGSAGSGRKLRWFEVRNELLKHEKLNPNFTIKKGDSSFNVKVSRALKRLEKQGILIEHLKGHKNTSYSLSENASEKLLKKVSSLISISPMSLGLFNPDDFLNLSYEQMKARVLKRIGEMNNDDWKKGYERTRQYILEKKREGEKEGVES